MINSANSKSNLTYEPVTIEIVYSNSETRKCGIKEGDIIRARQEYYKGNPRSTFFFEKDGNNCVAYDTMHDEDAYILVTTCKVVKEKPKTPKQIDSDINRLKAQINQVYHSELFSEEERKRLIPIYEAQLRGLEGDIHKHH
jgi:hypothetical protein